jgi:transcriptional regulator with XRE-family HTH domain
MVNVDKLLGRMKELHITQRELGNMVGMSLSTVNGRLKDKQGSKWTVSEMLNVADALKIESLDPYFFA